MKICKIYFILFVLLLSCFHLPNYAQASALVKLALRVVDEEMKPVEGANVRMCFYGGCLKKDATMGSTDSKGLFMASGASRDGQVGGAVEKAGYYSSTYHSDFMAKKFGFWLPQNKEITVVLRPIINPVPMYVRNRSFEIPHLGKEIGFDLMKFDWVMPYGQGVTADFIFKVDKRFDNVDDFDVTLTLTFGNPYDGIQQFREELGGVFNVGSGFRLLRNAPATGYREKIVKRIIRGNGVFYEDQIDDNNYFFRVRSEVDENGKLKRAMYGKIKGDIKLSPRTSKTLIIGMLYYLNPDYTLNMEFDPDRNLFSPLPKGELPIGLP